MNGMHIVKDGQCVNYQRFAVRENSAKIPPNKRLDLGDIIITRYVRDGGDKTIVNYALTKLGMNVELV
jgi:hypothetical protein